MMLSVIWLLSYDEDSASSPGCPRGVTPSVLLEAGEDCNPKNGHNPITRNSSYRKVG